MSILGGGNYIFESELVFNYFVYFRAAIGSGEYAISIPRYAVRGSGSSSMHYEYEITINLEADQWSIMRRYSRFRELHLTMRRRYGDAVS